MIGSASQITGNDTVTVQNLTKNQHEIPSLHEEVMKIEGSDEDELDATFGFLVQNEVIAKGFMAKECKYEEKRGSKFYHSTPKINNLSFISLLLATLFKMEM